MFIMTLDLLAHHIFDIVLGQYDFINVFLKISLLLTKTTFIS